MNDQNPTPEGGYEAARKRSVEAQEKEFGLIKELYQFLQGDAPDSCHIDTDHQPRLTQAQAATVIWFLQVHMCVLPDKYEQCDHCGNLYNSDAEGYYVDGDAFPAAPEEFIGRSYCDEECLDEAAGYAAWTNGREE